MTERKFRLLVTSIEARGHMNAALGFGEIMKSRGHEIVFAQRERFRDLAVSRGFLFEPFDEELFTEFTEDFFADWVRKNSDLFYGDWLENLRRFTEEDAENFSSTFEAILQTNHAIEKVFPRIGHVDAVISDLVFASPVVIKRNLIQFPICSLNPLMLYPDGPPVFSGFSLTKPDQDLCAEYTKLFTSFLSKLQKLLADWYISEGLPEYAEAWNPMQWIERPRFVGFYNYPEALDYQELGKPCSGWIRVDGWTRKADSEEFSIPECLVHKPGRLIYFSMGSIATNDHKVMNLLLKILAKSPHRFIVSTGFLGDQLELPNNMWGEPYVNQIKVIENVDLVITHGGNNSLMETLKAGKPLIVIPYFFDQLDNAQRVEQLGLGRRLDLHKIASDEQSLLDAIEYALMNLEVHEKVKKVSESMNKSDTRQKAGEIVEKIIQENKCSNNNNLEIVHKC